MNYGDIERQVFRTFLAFTSLMLILVLLFFNITRDIYRVSAIVYDTSVDLNIDSLEYLKGQSIWLIDDAYFESFYQDNPSVERIHIQKELPSTLLVQIDISEKVAFIRDNRQSPPRSFILYKNLYTRDTNSNEGLASIKINNGPVRDGFFEEVITFVLTLKKYPLNLSNIVVNYDGTSVDVTHFNSEFFLGAPSDLARKASVVGYHISEEPCEGEIRVVYTEDGKNVRAVTNCN
tara:strand:+ start:1661 stop:2362 length:702 start_codon:yes stop_codon:yes gene_type:complete